ncbi:MAG TPA: hypothetical protein VKH43_01595 [Thermoanaerobaculia bacterium]|nr:hypothetical protein [Thermoanaerobaculia bacterium]
MKLRIGQILVTDGVLADDAVVRALDYQRRSTEPFRLGSILLGWDLLGEETLLAALEKFHRCPSITWENLALAKPDAIRSFPRDRAIRLGALPVEVSPGRIRIAFRDPSNLVTVDEAAQVAGKAVSPLVATEVALALAHKKFYGVALPGQLRTIASKLGKRRPTPGAGIAITRPVETVQAAAPSDSREPDWPFWTPDEPAASPPPDPGDRLSWIREPQKDAAQDRGLDLDAGEARSRDQVAAPVLETLLAEFPRVIVLGVGKSEITGWTGRGEGLTRERVAAIRVPARGANVLAEVAATGSPHFGPVRSDRFPDALPPSRKDRSCAIFPIRVLDSVAGLLYADRLGEEMPFEDFALVARGAASAASLLFRFLMPE